MASSVFLRSDRTRNESLVSFRMRRGFYHSLTLVYTFAELDKYGTQCHHMGDIRFNDEANI
jgi:hypothetical protein